jgi:hypothetical protein
MSKFTDTLPGRRSAGRRLSAPTATTALLAAVALVLLSMFGVTTSAFAESLEPFGIASFDGSVTNEDGSVYTQAAGHPFDATTSFMLTPAASGLPTQSPKDLKVELPPGFVGNPTAAPECSQEAFIGGKCPPSTIVGIVHVFVGSPFPLESKVYNLTPPENQPAQFGFTVINVPVHANVQVRTGGDYGLTVVLDDIGQGLPISGAEMILWGVPASPSHEGERGAPSEVLPLPFLRNPTSCVGPLTSTLRVNSWQDPASEAEAQFVSHDNGSPAVPIGVTGCNLVPFSPAVTVVPTSSSADSPSGLSVDLHIPQTENAEGLSTADLKKAVVNLPTGMSINPSSANGLGACSAGEIEIAGPRPATCPDDSKIGSVSIETPLLKVPLTGSVYLASQRENKFGSLLATYIVAESRGVVIKLAGQIETGPSGQITATFDENPQLPFEDLRVEFSGGSKAALVTPPGCGTYFTTASLTPWSGKAPVVSTSSFQITSGPNGTACPNGSFNPKLEAGTTNPVAGKYSPFVLNLSREDGTQQLSTITAALPKGLLGKLAGIPYCPDSALGGIPVAEGTGAAQLANPSCPSASQLGTVSVGAGAGPSPFYVNTGKVYLAGPYKGAPLSLAIVTPALAGPFDLGNVVVRAALQVNPETTQITAVSDPLPTILQGIPLDLRSVAVNINREGFTLNPTSCNPMEVASTISGTGGGVAHPSSRFQVASCESLGFAPKLALNLKGGTTRAKNPALKAVLTAPAGQANIGKVQVILPKSVFIDSRHVNNPCTRVQFAEGAGNGTACPAKSILGKATAYSPLLAEPLKGNVYFRSNGGERKLPDLVASLNGQIHVNLVGFIDSVKQKGKEGSRVRNTFASVPDAPVSRFVLELQGGKKGLLQNSTNLCKTTNKATVKMDGQNGKVHDFETVVKPACGKKSSAKKPKKK